MANIVRIHDNQGNPAFAASHTKAVKVNGSNRTLDAELNSIHTKLDPLPDTVYLTAAEYEALVDAGTVDANTEYNIYEDEEP